MIVVALGLMAAFAYGAGDFGVGLASRRARSSLAVGAAVQLVVLAVFAVAMALSGEVVSAAALRWGALAGTAMGAGNIAYFRGLATGRMGLVATVTAVWAAVVPLVVGLALGERPSPLAWAGIAAIIAAITLITYTADPAAREARVRMPARARLLPGAARRPPATAARGIPEATAAGLGFGVFFVLLDQAGSAGGSLAAALLAAAAASATVVGVAAAARRVDWRPVAAQVPLVAVIGILHAAGSWAFVVGAGQGWVSIVAVIAALSPAPTMLLARVLLSESLTRRQLLGAAVALAGIALITGGLPS